VTAEIVETSLQIESVTFGNGGWVKIGLEGRPPQPFVLARFGGRGRLKLEELYLEGRISNPTLKKLSVPHLEDIANAFADDVKASIDIASCDLRTAASYYGTTFGQGAFDGNGRGNHWAVEMWASQYPAMRAAQAEHSRDRPVVRGVPDAPRERDLGTKHGLDVGDCRLDVPTTLRKPDEFYADVADLYRRLVIAGRDPAPAISAANTTPVTTVHRWIREARRRNLLGEAPGAGRVGEVGERE
jgi:hypothetical protein